MDKQTAVVPAGEEKTTNSTIAGASDVSKCPYHRTMNFLKSSFGIGPKTTAPKEQPKQQPEINIVESIDDVTNKEEKPKEEEKKASRCLVM
ncbi:hypothetical protein ABK040_002638 [Willaertia magna]